MSDPNVRFIIDRNGHVVQHFVALEELNELSKEILKWLRGRGDDAHLLEEIADVQLMLDQLMLMHNFDSGSVEKIKNDKIMRTVERIKGTEHGD